MPLDIIDQTEIRLSGFQDVGELLRYVPAVSGHSTSTRISNGGDGTATVTLRGLPANNTLVLLNGHRLNTDALRGQSVDLNTLPLGLVEQIEILKDGVSAIYGSDAVAGVVNIITKQAVQGISIDVSSGSSNQGDRDTQNISLSAGHVSDNWTVNGGLSYYSQNGILSRDRNVSASSDDRSRGGIDKRSSATNPARIVLPAGPVTLDGLNLGTQPSDFVAATDEDRFEYRDFTSAVVPSDRISAFLAANVNVGWWQAYLDAMITATDATSRLAPTPLFTAFETVPISISDTQIYNPFSLKLDDVRRRFTELPRREQRNESTTSRFIGGLRRNHGDLNLDVAIQYSRTDAKESFTNGLHLARVTQALSDSCVSPCIPLNLFGQPGSITEQMLDFVGTNATDKGHQRIDGTHG